MSCPQGGTESPLGASMCADCRGALPTSSADVEGQSHSAVQPTSSIAVASLILGYSALVFSVLSVHVLVVLPLFGCGNHSICSALAQVSGAWSYTVHEEGDSSSRPWASLFHQAHSSRPSP